MVYIKRKTYSQLIQIRELCTAKPYKHRHCTVHAPQLSQLLLSVLFASGSGTAQFPEDFKHQPLVVFWTSIERLDEKQI